MSGSVFDEARALVLREARLLDERRFEDWSGLFTTDAIYWVPLRHDQTDRTNEMSIMHDDRALMRARIARLRHPAAHADIPAPRTVHMISSLELIEDSLQAPVLAGALLMAEWRDQRQTVYVGRVEWKLKRETPDGGLQIAFKTVRLVNCDGFHQMITAPF